MKEFYIENEGIRLHAKLDRPADAGKGPLCILIHGFTGNMEEEYLLKVRDAILKAGVSVLRAEMDGHGGSGGAFRDHTLYKWLSDALAVIRYAETLEDVSDLYLCGHSQGGLLVMLLAGMCPDRFKGILPLSPAWMIPEVCRRGSLLGLDFDPAHVPEKITNEEEGWDLSGDYLRIAQLIYVEPAIARYDGPVRIVHGAEDAVVPYSYAEKAQQLYKNAELILIHGADHSFTDHEDELAQAVREFFTR